MKFKRTWLWHSVWVFSLIVGVGVCLLYAWLPVDGATGDMVSFTEKGFLVRWMIETRPGGLQEDDLILRAGGHTIEEWLNGAPQSPEWKIGETIEYEILREEESIILPIQLQPVAIYSVFARWSIQTLASLLFFLIGVFIFWQQPRQQAARVFMLFCVTLAMQYWGDAYNFQYAIIPRRWTFWLHFIYEFGIYSLSVASILYFAFLFPREHPLAVRYPRLLPLIIFGLPVLLVTIAMVPNPGQIATLNRANIVSWVMGISQTILTIAIGIRSVVVARDPVSRAQIRWILWSASVGVAIIAPGYIIPLIMGIPSLITHPVIMAMIMYMVFFIGVAILRHRLFDIEIIINRTIVYGLMSLVSICLFIIIISVSTIFIQNVLHREGDTFTVFLATISVTIAFSPLRQRIQRTIDRAFYKAKFDYQHQIPEFSQRLATGIVPDQIHNLLTIELPEQLQIEHATLLALDPAGQYYSSLFDQETQNKFSKNHTLIEFIRVRKKPFSRLLSASTLPNKILEYMNANQIEICIPLILRDEMVGLFNLGPKLSGNAFNREELTMLYQLGQHAAVAVENSRLVQTKDHQAEVLIGLHKAAVAVSGTLVIDELLTILVESVGRLLDVSNAYIYDIDEDSAQSVVLAKWLFNPNKNQTHDIGQTYDLNKVPKVHQALKSHQPLTIYATDDEDITENTLESIECYGIKAYLVMPLVIQMQIIGYLELWETRWDREFSDEDIKLCQTITTDGAIAIGRARMFEAERKQRMAAEAIQEAASIISSSLELDMVLDYIFGQMEKVINGDTFNIMLINDGIAKIIRGHGYGGEEGVHAVQEYAININGFPTLKEMARTSRPLLITDTSNHPLWTYKEEWQKPNSFIGAPICIGGKTVGYLNVNGNSSYQFDKDDAQWLETFANHAATAIERARLFEAERNQRKLAEALQGAASVVSSSLELDQVFDRILDQIKTVISGDTFNIMMIEDGIARIVRWRGYDKLEIAETFHFFSMVVDEYESFREMFATGRAIFIGETHHNPIWIPKAGWEWQRSYLGAPIAIEGKIVGFINVDGTEPNMFDASDANHLEVFAYHAATAIQNARLYEKVKDSLAEKEILLKEIHHRVKNNMQVIISMLNLQTREISDKAILDIFQDSQSRIRSMALVHDKLYRSEKLAEINFADYIRDLTHYLYSIYWNRTKDVDIDIQADEILLDIDTAVSSGLIINELLSNAFKHSFPADRTPQQTSQKNKIRISLTHSEENFITMVVSDNGITPENLDIENVHTLGFQLINALIHQLDGSMEMKTHPWTTFIVVFPYSSGKRK